MFLSAAWATVLFNAYAHDVATAAEILRLNNTLTEYANKYDKCALALLVSQTTLRTLREEREPPPSLGWTVTHFNNFITEPLYPNANYEELS
jgi:hypothetical protein